jgi:predicted acetyltransferase
MVSIHAAGDPDRIVVENLMQLYVYDWSELSGIEVDERGRFAPYPLDAYWRDEGRHPFLLRADDTLVGFALVQAESRLSGARGTFDMTEFFVLRRHRRRRVGLDAAALLFDRFCGPWEVRQRAENATATLFWRRAIAAYTCGRFEEAPWSDAKGAGIVQRFSSAR